MNILPRKKIVLLGMMTKIPVAGAVWGTMQYLLSLERLGYEAYYVEAHARTPSMLMRHDDEDSSALAAAFLDRVMRRFDMGQRWAFHALHDDGRCYGMSESQLRQLYSSASLLINYHGGTLPRPEHSATGRLIYLETDPVELEIELYHGEPAAWAFLEPHVAFFTWGLNYHQPDCRVPLPENVHFQPSPPVILPELWQNQARGPALDFTTVGNWRQGGAVTYQGETYTWSKNTEFVKFLQLPHRTGQSFELALSSFEEADRLLLERYGWKVREARQISDDLDAYARYVGQSRGEFTVAKDQNIRLRSGWFSERTAQYLACGRPAVTQETGFSNVLPTGRGLFAFTTEDEAVAAVEAINGDYATHCQAAREIVEEYFSYRVVLRRLLDSVGV